MQDNGTPIEYRARLFPFFLRDLAEAPHPLAYHLILLLRDYKLRYRWVDRWWGQEKN